jgi:hypothetical protein
VHKNLQIEGDPTIWRLESPIDPSQLTQASGPVSLPVAGPLKGNLLLSVKCAASVVLSNPDQMGAIPTDVKVPTAVLYLPSPRGVGVASGSHGYPLPTGTDLAALEKEITDAMNGGTRLAVNAGGIDQVVLVLDGGGLPFAVVCPPS